jgi:hypothetical protein
MLSLNLSQFTQYTNNQFYKFLLTQNQTRYHIIVPKSIDEGSEYFDITILADYFYITYAGELLNNISENFSYFTPYPPSSDPFFFKFTCSNLDALADVLFFLSKGLELDVENFDLPVHDKFKEEAHHFFTQALEDDDTNPVCYGLFQIACDYLNKT